MTTLELILTIIQLISGLAVTVIVLMQSGKSAGLSGAIAGGAETFLSKGQSQDARCQARQGDEVVRPRLCHPDAGADRPDAQGRVISGAAEKSASPGIAGDALFRLMPGISPGTLRGCRR